MQERSSSPPLGNILMFIAIVVLAMVVYPWVMHRFFPLPNVANPPAPQELKDDKVAGEKKPEKTKEKPADSAKAPLKEEKAKAEAGKEPKSVAQPAKLPAGLEKASPEKKIEEPRQWVTLGSADPDPSNPYRMLVTLSNEGASVARIELSSEHYRDLDDRGGYLGHLVMDNSDRKPGCLVQVVGAGTPAAVADIRPGDRILKLTYQGQTTEINNPLDKDPVSLETALHATKPDKSVQLEILRGTDQRLAKDVDLIRRPLEVIRPERKKPITDWIKDGPPDAIKSGENSPLSFLATLQRVDDDNPNNLPPDVDPEAKWDEELNREMPGVALRNATWHIESQTPGKVVFTCAVPEYHLTVTKTYELVRVEGDPAAEPDAKAYHLVLKLKVTNNDTKKHDVAYRLDGPNGLPVEGLWYVTTKVGRTWSAEGLRDVTYQLAKTEVNVATATQLSEKDKFYKEIGEATEFSDHPPEFFGVDAQYFSVAMLLNDKPTAANMERALALRVGEVSEVDQRRTLTNTSFRLLSKSMPLAANGGESPEQCFEIFAGPKRPQLLAKYELSPNDSLKGLICYGWPIFKWVAVPMTGILDFFYKIVHNYGLAIIMLTIVVRLSFYPVSRKQQQSAQLMQKIQPKLKELEKKHKGDWKALQQARQEMLAKYNYNPSSGCLLMFLQLPIFIGLYRALQVNVELRDAPLLSHAVRWCSNLAAPDMLYDWSWFMPKAVNNGIGFPGIPLFGSMLGMGPYLNLFPVITIVLFLVQQKVMMPPAADEQAAQQQKIMKYVMFLMGFMFFKVAAGLCIYFVATTLWGLAERRFMPKLASVDGDSDDAGVPSRPLPKGPERLSNSEREAIRRKKRNGKK